MTLFYVKWIIFVCSLFCAGLFAFLETAFTSLRLFKLKELMASANRYKVMLESWEKNPQRILITILIANCLAHVLASITITDIFQSYLGDTSLALAMGALFATAVILILGEIIPKTYAKSRSEALVRYSLWLLNLLFFLFYPIVTVCLQIARYFIRRTDGEKADTITEKEIQFLIRYGYKQGVLEEEKSEMLRNIFALGQTPVKEIMIPVSDMASLEVHSTIEQALETFAKFRFTRLPVYEGKEGNIIGFVHQKDIFQVLFKKEDKTLRDILLPILFIPESKKINQLLQEFLDKRSHMAILIDEFGTVMGLATLEDVIEEIVGDISDEHEKVHAEIVPLEKGGWMVDGMTSLEDVEETLGITFEVEDSVSLAGFLSERLGHLPKKGERVHYKGYCFQVQRASIKRVFKVLVFKDEGESKMPELTGSVSS